MSVLKYSSLSAQRAHFASLQSWVSTWKCWPVWSWIRAAEMFRRGQHKKAISLYLRGLDKLPNHIASNCARMDLARCYIADGQLLEAEKVLRSLSSNLPHSRRVQFALIGLQLRMSLMLDAAWTARRALRYIAPDEALISNYLFALVDNGGPTYLIKEARELVKNHIKDNSQLIAALEIRLILENNGYSPAVLKQLETLADRENATLEIILVATESLVRYGKIASARRLLSKAIQLDPKYPRVLSLYAETYLRAGPFYNSEYAMQLATDACKFTAWKSPRELHVLAEAFFHSNDLLSALATAELAMSQAKRLLGSYKDEAMLEQLIDTLKGDLSKLPYQEAA